MYNTEFAYNIYIDFYIDTSFTQFLLHNLF
jgi:hypothetical protein